ncbi:hypothetical protein DQD37_01880 [Salmonella enterica subsp. enterica serovar Cardoner]|uniref:Baseplate structural protein Gp10 C-terminal domain-containing protein n=1 Tax=Salmonella enterica subsp. enterica serovar Cardoner TaxID=2564309 RepID=A0A5W3RGG1_SALET|nr:hypothetical protein [Salmonella enterica subsp. enterica serovar Cardoner]EBW7241899.1 hypothetical protein [Salmonella enterica subsp. enterica serovar Cardoner]EBY8534635.1 hypothetical protein [Salmonella enterica subsp. enterica serovar Telelkebir]EEB7839162.1 hypothetical protein [Salmonella enterica subsp. enterica serovar Telelkebir]EHA9093048.1 hypothetical protein [Salmonella enterica subsp. enterica serovar Telelkebir]
MPIENATVISELNPDWPVGASDFVSQGDDQLRMLKKVLQNTLPNATAPITGTPDKLNNLTGGLNFVEGGDEIQSYWQLANPDGGSAVVLATAPMTLEGIKSGGEFALTLTTLHDVIFAVGSQYVNYIDSRNPVDILGFGTWEPVVGLIAGVGSAADNNSYTQNYSLGYQPGWWRVGNAQIVGQQLPVQLTMDPVDPHAHGEGEINSFYNDSGHTATVPGDGPGLTGSAGGHTPTGTGSVTIGSGGFTDGTPFYNPYYGAYIWKRTA